MKNGFPDEWNLVLEEKCTAGHGNPNTLHISAFSSSPPSAVLSCFKLGPWLARAKGRASSNIFMVPARLLDLVSVVLRIERASESGRIVVLLFMWVIRKGE
jgi:hypothetical protein